jgi:hypothetical protein
MPAKLNTWERSRFEPGGSNALVCYAIYGRFTNDGPVSGAAYRTAGIPRGVELRHFSRAQTTNQSLPFAGGDLAAMLRKSNPALFAWIEQSPECLVMQGEVADPPNLDYLRDCVGMVAFFMDHGGVAVTDVQQFRLYDAAGWRSEFFEPDKPRVLKHVSILYSEEEAGPGIWFHTRGLRKFGRPDLSLRHVPERYKEAAVELCNRFIELQASGGRILESQEVRMRSLPGGLVCHHKGSLEDPDFNNVHVEIVFPGGL